MKIRIYQKTKEIFDPENNKSLGILEHPVLEYDLIELKNEYNIIGTNVFIKLLK